ncbi:MAG: hypothetical protein CL861_07375 [Cyanobium sp. MED843]|nr:hypothetical protein [Cyanobium sp. MED843]
MDQHQLTRAVMDFDTLTHRIEDVPGGCQGLMLGRLLSGRAQVRHIFLKTTANAGVQGKRPNEVMPAWSRLPSPLGVGGRCQQSPNWGRCHDATAAMLKRSSADMDMPLLSAFVIVVVATPVYLKLCKWTAEL